MPFFAHTEFTAENTLNSVESTCDFKKLFLHCAYQFMCTIHMYMCIYKINM